MITFRYLATRYAFAAMLALTAICSIYLIVDFVDRAKFYSGDGWLLAVLELYGLKGLIEINQLLPAALAIGSAVAMSGLRKKGEVTALWALGRGPMTFIAPIVFVSGACALTVFLAQDNVIGPANRKADEISALRFHWWGDWSTYHRQQTWFRGDKGRFIHLEHSDGEGFAGMTIFELSPEFRLERRTDAKRIQPVGHGDWRMTDVVRRSFSNRSELREEREPEVVEHFPEDLSEFRVRGGHPAQVPLGELPVEISLRKRLGLPSAEWEYALTERRTYQAIGVPGALIGMALALRPRRRGHLTAATGEGFGVTLCLWAISALSRTLTLAGHFSPFVGGMLPLMLAIVAAAVTIRVFRHPG